MFIEDDPETPWFQGRSIGMSYINYFAIDEDDQFEIVAIHELSYSREDLGDEAKEKVNTAMQAVVKVTQQKEGSEYFLAIYVLLFQQ